MGKKKNIHVRAVRLNWDIECFYDIINKKGFMITEPATFTTDETKQKTLYGSRSILYGTNYEDETAFIERHRCKCGAFKGALFKGEICPYCNTKVEAKETDIEFTGWISLHGNFVLNPYYYQRLCALIGTQVLPEIITAKTRVDIDGNFRIATAEDLGNEVTAKHPFVGIGLIEFRKRFEEIMNYFKAKKKKKAAEFDRILSESSSVFCSYIPIYSTFLRPQSCTNDTYYYNSIDKQINPLFSLSERIRDAEEIDRVFILGRIQQRVNALWEENFNLLNGKEGLIRGQILGGSLESLVSSIINASNCGKFLLGYSY